jgi:DNA-binding NarL/FixJ family response regulator
LRVPRQRLRGHSLNRSEQAIARLVQEGRRNRDIADVLCLSPKTVDVYLSRLYARLGISSRLELARLVDGGLLDPDAE